MDDECGATKDNALRLLETSLITLSGALASLRFKDKNSELYRGALWPDKHVSDMLCSVLQ